MAILLAMLKKKAKKKILRAKTPSKGPRRQGRPTLYEEYFPELAYQQCLCGALDSDLIDFFEISSATFYEWKLIHPRFSESIKAGKQYADGKVANAMFLRATGYSHPEEKIFCHEGNIIRAETTKHYPPDTTSMIFWLKNRQPAKWRDKVEEPPAPPNQTIDVLALLIQKAEKATRLLPSELDQLIKDGGI